jgi:hypothetical protein
VFIAGTRATRLQHVVGPGARLLVYRCPQAAEVLSAGRRPRSCGMYCVGLWPPDHEGPIDLVRQTGGPPRASHRTEAKWKSPVTTAVIAGNRQALTLATHRP